jgi:hypothetical protein
LCGPIERIEITVWNLAVENTLRPMEPYPFIEKVDACQADWCQVSRGEKKYD